MRIVKEAYLTVLVQFENEAVGGTIQLACVARGRVKPRVKRSEPWEIDAQDQLSPWQRATDSCQSVLSPASRAALSNAR